MGLPVAAADDARLPVCQKPTCLSDVRTHTHAQHTMPGDAVVTLSHIDMNNTLNAAQRSSVLGCIV